MSPNEYTITLKLKRGQAVRLLLLLSAHIGTLRFKYPLKYEKEHEKALTGYERIHDEIRAQLDEFDAKRGIGK